MTTQWIVTSALAAMGVLALASAIVNERRMQRHRRAGVSYRDVTFRRDGAWRRADLFTDEGLAHQRRASTFGVVGTILLVLALVAWVLLGRG